MNTKNNKKIVKAKNKNLPTTHKNNVFQTNRLDLKIRTSARNFKHYRKIQISCKLKINSVSDIKQSSSDCVIIIETPLKISKTL